MNNSFLNYVRIRRELSAAVTCRMYERTGLRESAGLCWQSVGAVLKSASLCPERRR